MKPIIILPPDTMSEEDIKTLRDNDLCVVVSTDPAKVKFVDPIPCVSSRTQIEEAAIQLSRKLLAGQIWSGDSVNIAAKHFVQILVKGSPLSTDPTQAEMERQAYDGARLDEVRRIAREDARQEKQEKELAKAAAKTTKTK